MVFLRKIKIFRFGTGNKTGKRWNKPESFNAFCGSYLIFIQSQFWFAVTKKDFNIPSFSIHAEYVFSRKLSICTKKSSQGFWIMKSSCRICNEYNSVINVLKLTFDSANKIFASFYCNGVKEPVFFANVFCKLADTDTNSGRKYDSVCFECSNCIESFLINASVTLLHVYQLSQSRYDTLGAALSSSAIPHTRSILDTDLSYRMMYICIHKMMTPWAYLCLAIQI